MPRVLPRGDSEADKLIFTDATVRIGGLVNRADLNDKESTVQAWNAEKGRWAVLVDTAARAAVLLIRPANLTLVRLSASQLTTYRHLANMKPLRDAVGRTEPTLDEIKDRLRAHLTDEFWETASLARTDFGIFHVLPPSAFPHGGYDHINNLMLAPAPAAAHFDAALANPLASSPHTFEADAPTELAYKIAHNWAQFVKWHHPKPSPFDPSYVRVVENDAEDETDDELVADYFTAKEEEEEEEEDEEGSELDEEQDLTFALRERLSLCKLRAGA